jgi:hypothetical protein
MSPEQIRNLPISPHSDLYALGCLLHEVLSGGRVFDAEDEIALMYQHLDAAPTPLRQLVPEVPAELEELVLELLAKQSADRPESAWAVYDRLVPFLPASEPTSADQELPVGAIPDPTRPYRRPGAPRPRPRAITVPAPSSKPSVDQEEIDDAFAQVEELVDHDRFTQATDMLAELIPRASAALGAEDGSVLDLRIRYAATLFLGGDYRRAAPQFDALAATLERIDGPLSEETLDYRRQAVVCRIALGETDAALPELESIIRAYEQTDAESPGSLSLRLNLAQLRVSAGQQKQAADELRQLYDDAVRILGRGDELTAEIDELRSRLHRATTD